MYRLEQNTALGLENQLHQIPEARLNFIQQHGITGADHFLERNSPVKESLDNYLSQVAHYIREYGYIPKGLAIVSDSGGGKSGLILRNNINMMSNPDISDALNSRNAVLEHHVITTGSAFEAAMGEPGLLETQDRKPTEHDFMQMYSIMVLGLETDLFREKISSLVERRSKSKSGSNRKENRKHIKALSIEGSFSPEFLNFLAQLPSFEKDEDGKDIPPLKVIGIVPSLEAQLRAAKVRDTIIAVKQQLDSNTLVLEDLEELIHILTEKGFELGQEKSLTPEILLEIVSEFPQQGGSSNIIERRKKTNRFIAEQMDLPSQDKNWAKWLDHNDEERQKLLSILMERVFSGKVFPKVQFPDSVVGRVGYDSSTQYHYPKEFSMIERELVDIAALFQNRG